MGRQRKADTLVREIVEVDAGERGVSAVVLGMALAAHHHIRHGAVQRIGIAQLCTNVGVAVHAASRHHFAAPRIDVAGRTVAADVGVRLRTADRFAGLAHRIERSGIEHRSAARQRHAADDQHRDEASYHA